MFRDEELRARCLQALRWPSRFVYRSCRHAGAPYEQSRARLVCPQCRHQTTATAGTILDKTRTELGIWFEAARHLTTAKNSLSAKTLERTPGTSYRAAWLMLQRSRVAMVRSERTQLSGRVEVDECTVGGIDRGRKPGRGSGKNVVLVAVELRDPKGLGRARLRHAPNASKQSIRTFVHHVVAEGAEVITDGWGSYGGLSTEGFVHTKHQQAQSSAPPHRAMPGPHRVASPLERWLHGTHQGSFRSEHLQSSLEVLTFRFNRRTSRSRGLVFRRLLEQTVVTAPVTEADVIGRFDWALRHNPE